MKKNQKYNGVSKIDGTNSKSVNSLQLILVLIPNN